MSERAIRLRMRALRAALREREIDAALIINRANTHWLTGFRGTHSFTMILPRGVVFITDGRYIESVRGRIPGARVTLQRSGASQQIADLLGRQSVGVLGLEGSIPHEQWVWVRRLIPKGTRLANIASDINALRAIKDRDEILKLKRAVALTDAIFADAVPWIRGCLRRDALTERDVALWLKRQFEDRGGEGPSFPPIVAAGPNSALPHAVPGSRRIRSGQFLLMDFGLVLDGYCSDMTRTIFIGKPRPRHRRIYDLVHEAQAAGIAAVRAGARLSEVDAAARQVIADVGHGKDFSHSLGHGVGIEIHEEPRLSPMAKGRLQAGQVVTIEPGVYLPGFGGVRIEDVVVVGEAGCRVLTQSTKELICL